MTEAKRPLKVFLCHAHADRSTVYALYTRLKKYGVDAWLDKEKLIPGQDWELEIRKAVREADVVVVCLSKLFKQKGFRQREVQIALEEASLQPEGEIFIIPARLEECDTLESLRKWHWVDLFEKGGYENLIRALRLRSDNIGATLHIRKSPKSHSEESGNKIRRSLSPKIFISYSHRDEKYKDELVKMLATLENQDVITIWHDREIEAGDEWYGSIKNAMNTCDLALLLVSADFLDSRFIRDEELTRLLQHRKEKGLRVVPIIIRHCIWQSVPVLRDIQALPKDGKPVVEFQGIGTRERVWAEIATAINHLVR